MFLMYDCHSLSLVLSTAVLIKCTAVTRQSIPKKGSVAEITASCFKNQSDPPCTNTSTHIPAQTGSEEESDPRKMNAMQTVEGATPMAEKPA